MAKLIRKNVWELGGDWAAPILWYARGVKAMKARRLAERTSWGFFGAMHGINRGLWTRYGYLSAANPEPAQADVDLYFDQCQHGSWYFLPWHRGYLMALEDIIRGEIAKLDAAAAASWALPYWNYYKPNQNALPPAFATNQWPDGGDNPLYVAERWGYEGSLSIPPDGITLTYLADNRFTGTHKGGSPGFGGPKTTFSHGPQGDRHGGLEFDPHDQVHGLIGGGQNQQTPGLMSDPDTAGLDPIFWLHHANIDRLWEVWRQKSPGNVNPAGDAWNKGPAAQGERSFVMPKPDGTPWVYTPVEISDLSQLNYGYDSYDPGAPMPETPARRVERLMTMAGRAPIADLLGAGAAPMQRAPDAELIGASQQQLHLVGKGAVTTLHLDQAPRTKVGTNLSLALRSTAGQLHVPDRVFLNLEQIRGYGDGTVLKVFLVLPNGDEKKAGLVSLFGVRKASTEGGQHGGQGLTFQLDITGIIDALHLQGALDQDQLKVRIEPARELEPEANLTIQRVSIYREGQ